MQTVPQNDTVSSSFLSNFCLHCNYDCNLKCDPIEKRHKQTNK